MEKTYVLVPRIANEQMIRAAADAALAEDAAWVSIEMIMEVERHTPRCLVDIAYHLCVAAHWGQVDKAGEDYIDHPRRIACSLSWPTYSDPKAEIVALLHDVLEDSEAPDAWLGVIAAKFGEEIAGQVLAITRHPMQTYEAYIDGLNKPANAIAKRVKTADLYDNLDIGRLCAAAANGHDVARLVAKYMRALISLGVTVD